MYTRHSVKSIKYENKGEFEGIYIRYVNYVKKNIFRWKNPDFKRDIWNHQTIRHFTACRLESLWKMDFNRSKKNVIDK